MTEIPLSEYALGTLDAAGNGAVRLGPRAHGVTWRPQTVGIRMTGAAPAGLATCTVYVGTSPTDDAFVDATYDVVSASTGRVGGTVLRLGQYVWAVWRGGNPGAEVTLTLNGRQDV